MLAGIEPWMVTSAATVVMTFVFAWTAWMLLVGTAAGRQWRTNPIATATAAIFVTCSIGHAMHLEHSLQPWLSVHLGLLPLEHLWVGEAALLGQASRLAMGDPRLMVVDVATAGAALLYFSLRSRLPALLGRAALCEDLERRHQDAVALQDGLVQGIVQARMELALGRTEQGARTVADTLETGRRIIDRLMGEEDASTPPRPGDLRRSPAGR